MQDILPRTLKSGDTFGVFDRNGDINAADGADGLFFCDTRHLSRFRLSLCDRAPLLLSSALRDDNGALSCDLTNPDLADDNEVFLEHDLIHLRRLKFIRHATCFERLAIRNYSAASERITVSLDFSADFADLFEVRGTPRQRRGVDHPAKVDSHSVTFSYTGLDHQDRKTRLRFWPDPVRLSEGSALFEFILQPHARAVLFIETACDPVPVSLEPPRLFYRSLRAARRDYRQASMRMARLATSNDILNQAIDRANADLHMLNTTLPDGPYPYAGIPWFSTVFGRDGIITALQTLWLDPSIAKGVLAHLAAHQADRLDNQTDAEPGKILHEMRSCEMANTGEVPFGRYYGSIDSTPLFVMLAGAYFERTRDRAFIRRLWPNILAALDWIDAYGDRDGDGFVEYFRATKDGLLNQGWKDSHDSIFHADGALAKGPIALVEVQAYVYAAKRAAAEMASVLGDADRAASLLQQAEDLRRAFDAAFWDDALGTYVLALDGEKRPCRVATSNAGHTLLTGIASPERARRVAQTLMSRTSFSGWGIRTVASTAARYNPMSYHNGSIWPHDNALIAAGFARYGLRQQVAQLFDGLFSASTYIELRRLPELFCGFLRVPGQGPTFYPLACSPQAWAATATLSLLQSSLGLRFDHERRKIALTNPVLPPFLDDVTIRGLTLDDASIDIAVHRADTDIGVDVLSRRGDIDVALLH